MCIVLITICAKLQSAEKCETYPVNIGAGITYIMIDGLDKKIFKKLIEENRLKNLKQYMYGGLYVENGIGSFPSMTGYAFYPFLTGVDAVNSGVLGLRWFDRRRQEGKAHRSIPADRVAELRTLGAGSWGHRSAPVPGPPRRRHQPPGPSPWMTTIRSTRTSWNARVSRSCSAPGGAGRGTCTS